MMKPLIRIAVVAVILAVAGCGPSTAELTGKATYQGKPIVYGSVVVIDASGASKSGAIEPDGTFRVKGVVVGPVKVAVTSSPPPGLAPSAKLDPREVTEDKPREEIPPAPPEVLKAWFPIPEKYSDPMNSGLNFEAKSGTPLNLDLK